MKNLYACIGLFLLIRPAFGLTITSPVFTKTTYERYEKAEATFSIDESFTNPYDPDVVSVDAEITPSGGSVYTAPCFYFVPVTYAPAGTNSWTGSQQTSGAKWMLRFAPAAASGSYSVRIRVTRAGTTTYSSSSTFTVSSGSRKGFVRIHPTNKQFLQFDNGTPYHPVGYNICWNDGRITEFYNQFFNAIQPNGINWTRYWLSGFSRQALEWQPNHWSGWYKGLGTYSQEAAGILDYTLSRCEQSGIYLQLVLQHHGQYSTTTDANWHENPYNQTFPGGFLTNPGEFFSNAAAKAQTKKMYRYVVARWGYSTNILNWELFNEVQFAQGNLADIDTWLDEMSQYLKAIDPQRHLVATSADVVQFPSLDNNVALDQLQYHIYANSITQSNLVKGNTLRSQLSKSVLNGEYGTSTAYGTGSDIFNDTEGDHVRKTSWIGAMNQMPSMFWFWSEYIRPKNLYNLLKPLTDFLANEDIVAMNPSSNAVLSFQQNPGNATALTLTPGNTNWSFTNVPNPWSTTIDASGQAPGLETLSSTLQGSWQGSRSREASFTAHFLTTGSASVTLQGSSSSGSNRLEMYLDGVLNATHTVANGAAGTYTISNIPAGTHTIRFLSAGQDWLHISHYSFVGVTSGGRCQAYGYVGAQKALGYVTDTYGNYATDASLGSVSGASLQLPMNAGTYAVQFTNPRTGQSMGSLSIPTTGGQLIIPLPVFTKDLAFKATYTEATAATDEVIYDEQLGTNWENYSYQPLSFDFQNATRSYSGSRSIRAAPATAWEAASFYKSSPIDPATYPKGIRFWAYGAAAVSGQSTVKLGVLTEATSTTATSTTKVIDVPTGQWTPVSIAWNDLGNPSSIQRISIKDYSGTTGQVFFLDDLRLVALDTPLPVELTEFSAIRQEKTSVLRWTTTQEKNNRKFRIQRSLDARQWETIGTVAGANTTTQVHRYSYRDVRPAAGVNYYRLLSVDDTEKFSISRTVSVPFPGEVTFRLYPNPAQDKITIRSPLPLLEITIQTADGVVVSHVVPETSSSEYTVSIKELPYGVYFADLVSAQKRQVIRFLKK